MASLGSRLHELFSLIPRETSSGCGGISPVRSEDINPELRKKLEETITGHLHGTYQALRQTFMRKIDDLAIRDILGNGIIIEEYHDDTPCPSYLVAGTDNGRRFMPLSHTVKRMES